jgi:hypothetical protein
MVACDGPLGNRIDLEYMALAIMGDARGRTLYVSIISICHYDHEYFGRLQLAVQRKQKEIDHGDLFTHNEQHRRSHAALSAYGGGQTRKRVLGLWLGNYMIDPLEVDCIQIEKRIAHIETIM